MAGGAAFWGIVARSLGVAETFGLASAYLAAVAVFVHVLGIPEASADDIEPREISLAAPSQPIDPRAGPIVVNIEYRVAAANAVEFMSVMRQLRRLRRRDGARDWSLMQDIDDPTLWIERFHSPTWRDYVHRLTRPVAGDEPIRTRVQQLADPRATVIKRRLDRPAGSQPLGEAQPAEAPVEIRS